jgi:ATP/maltotriose-dependent transcriptional regulator MalT
MILREQGGGRPTWSGNAHPMSDVLCTRSDSSVALCFGWIGQIVPASVGWQRAYQAQRPAQSDMKVLKLLVAGRTNRQLAEQLFISPRTAAVHVSSLFTNSPSTTKYRQSK